MTKKFVDCFMLMGTALSIRGGHKLPEMGRPLLQDLITTNVNLSLSIQELNIVNHKDLEVELTALLNQKWVDPRLGANAKTRKMAATGQIWKPKIVNVNGVSTPGTEDTIFWRGFGDEGNVLLSEKITVKSFCTKDYKKFPFDTQICSFKFGTYRFPHEEVAIMWDSVPLHHYIDLNFITFNVTHIVTFIEMDIRCSGNFSVALAQFVFKRNIEHYINCIFLPAIIFTLFNYVSLWLNLNKRSFRLYLNLSVFGFMIFLYYVSVCFMHPTPYFKASDIFLLICNLFSVITFLETVAIDVLCSMEESQFHLKKLACSREYPANVYWPEFALKVSYPVLFIFFVTLYCWMYL